MPNARSEKCQIADRKKRKGKIKAMKREKIRMAWVKTMTKT